MTVGLRRKGQMADALAAGAWAVGACGVLHVCSRQLKRGRRSRPQSAMVALSATVDEKGKAESSLDVVFEAKKLFLDGSKTAFAPNVWYESPEITTSTRKRVWQRWRERPTRNIERISDGADSVGCTWTQVDGRRGASFLRFNADGEVTFIREVVEPPGWSKFSGNTMASLTLPMAVVGAYRRGLNFLDQWLTVEDKNRGPLTPKEGLAAPTSRRASAVVAYLWDEAQYDPENAVERIVEEYSDDAVYEDMTCKDEVWAQGKDAIRKYMQETRDNSPDNLTFVLDELSTGTKACVALWHVEFAGQNSPRGVTYYEVDEAGKICYARASYDLNF